MTLHFVAVELVSWIRRNNRYVSLATLFVYLAFVGGTWLVVSTQLPHRDVRWPSLVPGAALFGVGLLGVNVFNVYVTTRLVEGRADTYGALGVATALLFSLVLVGRLMVVSAVLNASLYERRTRSLGGKSRMPSPLLQLMGEDVVEPLELLNVPSYLIDAAGMVL